MLALDILDDLEIAFVFVFAVGEAGFAKVGAVEEAGDAVAEALEEGDAGVVVSSSPDRERDAEAEESLDVISVDTRVSRLLTLLLRLL